MAGKVAVKGSEYLRAVHDQRAEERRVLRYSCQRVAAVGKIGANEETGLGRTAVQAVGIDIADQGVGGKRPCTAVDPVKLAARQACRLKVGEEQGAEVFMFDRHILGGQCS